MSIELVQEFAKKFDLPAERSPRFPSIEDMEFRLARLSEEYDELTDAYEDDNLVEFFDAMLDLAYVLYGTALRVGITPEQWQQGFAAVHAANMAKVKVRSAEHSRFGNKHDIAKPDGWKGPEQALKQILGF